MSSRPRAPHRGVSGMTTGCCTTWLISGGRALPFEHACASQHRHAHTPTVRRQTPTPACVVKRDSVRQTPVFTAPPRPTRAQVVIFARVWMGPRSTRSTARAGQRYVILSMACTATPLSTCALLSRSVLWQMALLPTLDVANAAMLHVLSPQGWFVIRRMEEGHVGRRASVHSVILKKRVQIVGLWAIESQFWTKQRARQQQRAWGSLRLLMMWDSI